MSAEFAQAASPQGPLTICVVRNRPSCKPQPARPIAAERNAPELAEYEK
jgi:hypothetical protein